MKRRADILQHHMSALCIASRGKIGTYKYKYQLLYSKSGAQYIIFGMNERRNLCSPPLIETYHDSRGCCVFTVTIYSVARLYSSVFTLLQKPANVRVESRNSHTAQHTQSVRPAHEDRPLGCRHNELFSAVDGGLDSGGRCYSNKCIGDDTKAAARQSLNCNKNKNKIKYGEKTIFNMPNRILTPCNVARSRH